MRRSRFLQMFIVIILAIIFTGCGGDNKEEDALENSQPSSLPSTSEGSLITPKRPQRERAWLNVDCGDADRSSDFYFWVEEQNRQEFNDLSIGLCSVLAHCTILEMLPYVDHYTVKMEVSIESVTDIPSDGSVEVTIIGRNNNTFKTGAILGEFTTDSHDNKYDFQWRPSLTTSLRNLDLVLKFITPQTDSNQMDLDVYYEDVLVGGTTVFKDLEADDPTACPSPTD